MQEQGHGSSSHPQSAFKKQVVQEYAAGATLNALEREHDLSRTLIRIWIAKCESGEFDPDVEAATLLGDYEAKIATLERMVGRQAVEIEFLRGALQQGRSPRSAPMSVIAGPAVSPSLKDAGERHRSVDLLRRAACELSMPRACPSSRRSARSSRPTAIVASLPSCATRGGRACRSVSGKAEWHGDPDESYRNAPAPLTAEYVMRLFENPLPVLEGFSGRRAEQGLRCMISPGLG